MNQMSGTGVPPAAAGGPKSFFQYAMSALTKPSVSTFAEIAASPSASITSAYLWVFVGALVESFLSALLPNSFLRNMMSQYGLANSGGGFGATLIRLFCGAPIGALLTTIFFAIDVLIIQLIAKMLGGKGTYSQLAYTWAAIALPFSVVTGVLSLLSSVPFVVYCAFPLLILLILYLIVLNVMAIKAVHQFGWGQAIGSLLIVIVLFVVLCGCIAFVTFMALGPVIGNVFSSINQSLTTP